MPSGKRRAAVLTISDGVFHGTRDDDSGRLLAEALTEAGFEVSDRQVVQDDRRDIEPAIVALAERNDLVLTTGGTGLGPRDVTPEATQAVLDRQAPGFAEAMRADGRAKTPMAILSRGISGVVQDALVVNLPGSPKACKEGLGVVLPLLGHAIDLITGYTRHQDGPPRPKHRPGESEHAGKATAVQASPPSGAKPAASGSEGLSDASREVAGLLAKRIDGGEESLLATAIRREGSPPCALGQKMLLGREGPLAGTLGCSDFDTAVAREAASVLSGGQSVVRTLEHDLGTVDVYLEPYTRRPKLVVVGATPVALWLLRWGRDLGYEPILIEDREGWITPEHRAAASRVEKDGASVGPGTETNVVHTDHESPAAAEQLAALLPLQPRFTGIVGSARHTAPHIAKLSERGLDEDQIAAVQSPVGLDLGSRTPQEIALSILAGLLRHHTGRDGRWLDARFEKGGSDEG